MTRLPAILRVRSLGQRRRAPRTPRRTPAQLALALNAARLPGHEATAIYQDLLRGLAARLAESQWQLDPALFDELLVELCAEAAAGDAGRDEHDPDRLAPSARGG
jgi:hypothetical protein